MVPSPFHCGFVGILGPTNTGKSTLLNAIVGSKVSIVSPLPQTTYHPIKGICHGEGYQLIFVDTPGLQKYSHLVARLLNSSALKQAQDCDVLLWVFDVQHPRLLAQLRRLSTTIEGLGKHSICILNKVDLVPKPTLLPLMSEISATQLFQEIIPLSARKKDGVEKLIATLVGKVPERAPQFPQDQLSERSVRFLASEFIREKVYQKTRGEVPYSVRVEIEEWKEGKIPHIGALIFVDSESRKRILVGRGGTMLKEIGISARKDIELLVEAHINLKLFVKVDRLWKEKKDLVREYLEL